MAPLSTLTGDTKLADVICELQTREALNRKKMKQNIKIVN